MTWPQCLAVNLYRALVVERAVRAFEAHAAHRAAHRAQCAGCYRRGLHEGE
jgi:hypothetical protein